MNGTAPLVLAQHVVAQSAGHGVYKINFLQAIVIGLIQGISELFPVSSLGHTVLIPSWIGGTWATLVRQEATAESPYLAFVVGLHLATAVVLLGFYLREWIRLIAGFFGSIFRRKVVRPEEKLAWFIVIATVPAGVLGIEFEHQFRVVFAKPLAASLFLMTNGIILAAGEWFHRHPIGSRLPASAPGDRVSVSGEAPPSSLHSHSLRELRDDRIVTIDEEAERELSKMGAPTSFVVGALQALALFAGISREGVTMVGGLFRGLSRENALRFAFLLSTPVIFAAGALKVPDLLGHLGNGIRGQVVVGSIAAVATSLFAVVFLTRWFKTRTLWPFAIYSLLFGLASAIRFGAF